MGKTPSIVQLDKAQKYCDTQFPAGYGYRETFFYPATFKAERFTLPELKEMVEQAYTEELAESPFLYPPPNDFSPSDDYYEFLDKSHFSEYEKEFFHYWRFYRSGLLYTLELILEDRERLSSDLQSKHLPNLAYRAILCMINLYKKALVDTEVVTLVFGFGGMKGRCLTLPNNMCNTPTFRCSSEKIASERTTSLAEWCVAPEAHAVHICEYVSHKFNWPNPDLEFFRNKIEQVKSGKRENRRDSD